MPDGVYLLSHSVGLPPSSSTSVFEQFVKTWTTEPAASWPRWLRGIDDFRRQLARLFSTDLSSICPQNNVSSGTTKIIHSLPHNPTKPTIVMSARTFPSLGFVTQAAERAGYRTRTIPAEADTTDPTTWRDALTEDVGVVVVCHAESDTGCQLPVADIVKMARTNGTYSLVDVAQSAGVLPIDVTEWDADFVVGSCIKWLCGGAGAGFLWANPEIVERCEPLDVGWFSHDDPFEFDIDHFRFAEDALRFWGGTPSPLPSAVAGHSLSVINSIGVDKIRAHNLELTDRLIAGVRPTMLRSPSERRRRSGTVIISPGVDKPNLADRLVQAGVQIDQRDTGIRVSPHLYSGTDDIDAVIEVIET